MVVIVGTFFMGCKNDIKVVQELGEEDTAPFQTTYEGHYTFTDSGKVRNTLWAGKLEQFIRDSNYTQVSEGLILEIFNRSETLAARLTAQKGIYFEDLDLLKAEEDVVFVNPAGDSLFTASLVWQSDSNLIYTNDLVRIVRQGTEIRGKGMRSNEDFSRYSILAPVGDIFVPEELNKDESEEGQ